MTWLCVHCQIQIHHQESIHLNASATSSCSFELSWEPEIQKFIYNQLSEYIFEAQLRSHPLCFATPRCPTFCPPIVSACRFSQGGGVLINCLRRFVREGRPRCGDFSRWWLTSTPLEKCAKVKMDHFPSVEIKKFLKPPSSLGPGF